MKELALWTVAGAFAASFAGCTAIFAVDTVIDRRYRAQRAEVRRAVELEQQAADRERAARAQRRELHARAAARADLLIEFGAVEVWLRPLLAEADAAVHRPVKP